MSTFDHVTNVFGCPLDLVALQYGYSPENICILAGDEARLIREYPTAYSNVLSCAHHSDRRAPFEYAQDLVASWLIEDYYLGMLSQAGLTINLNGADRERKILRNTKTSTSCDFNVSYNGSSRRCELMNDYGGFWFQYSKLHLRDNKYEKLANDGALLLAISVSNNQFAFLDFSNRIPARYIASHRPYGGKSAYEIDIPNSYFSNATGENMVGAIINAI